MVLQRHRNLYQNIRHNPILYHKSCWRWVKFICRQSESQEIFGDFCDREPNYGSVLMGSSFNRNDTYDCWCAVHDVICWRDGVCDMLHVMIRYNTIQYCVVHVMITYDMIQYDQIDMISSDIWYDDMIWCANLYTYHFNGIRSIVLSICLQHGVPLRSGACDMYMTWYDIKRYFVIRFIIYAVVYVNNHNHHLFRNSILWCYLPVRPTEWKRCP